MIKKSGTDPMRIGVAWFDREQWQRLLQVAPDRDELDDTFQQWERNAQQMLKVLKRGGQKFEKVPINVDDLMAWCTVKGLRPDGSTRSEYVAELLRKKYARNS